MKNCTFSELCKKQVINVCDCRQLGYITDIAFELDTGRITCIKVCEQGSLFCFGKGGDKCISIPWECIKKIGDDIILTDIVCPSPPPPPKKPAKPRKFFFSE